MRRETSARLEVADRGPGIPAAFRPRIFTRFAQAEGSDAKPGSSSGLGRAIVQRLVRAMGGSVGFHSVEGQGCAFFVDLPLPAARAAAATA